MELPNTIQGRPFGPQDLADIQALLRQHPDWSRYRLSRELATLWNWRTPAGQLKDMAARSLLLKLHQRGWIQLPARRMASPTRSGRQAVARASPGFPPQDPLECPLATLLPLRILEVSQKGHEQGRRRLEQSLAQHHYLGYRSRVGQNLQYWIDCAQGRPLACVVFGAAAWRCAVRDQWIGWNDAQRALHLHRIANNTRFLIFPWVRVEHLASHVLGRIARRVRADWRAKYHQPLDLLETFVDRQRFLGSCYRAANWIALGQTKGLGRQREPAPAGSIPIKDVYVYPLHRRSIEQLTSLTHESSHAR